ncbi:MAG: SDR family oxidoreductase [Actinomycetia bacterium]|nr:SDR family oxidoreductase [Actinomycetes bacterium]
MAIQDKVAIITGVSRGIGKAICEKFINEGYIVHGTYNTSKKEAEELKKQYKEKLEIYKVDFSIREQTIKLIDKFTGIKMDVLINNAGMFEGENFEKFNLDIWFNTLEVNLNAPFLLAIKLHNNIRKGGSIINIASTDGFIGSFGSISYSVSKSALINVTKSLANNLGKRDIRVNAIAPGWINTGMSTDESLEAVKLTPLKRNGKPEEVADLALFLASNKASFITGTTIVIDGAYACVDYIMKKEAESFK